MRIVAADSLHVDVEQFFDTCFVDNLGDRAEAAQRCRSLSSSALSANSETRFMSCRTVMTVIPSSMHNRFNAERICN